MSARTVRRGRRGSTLNPRRRFCPSCADGREGGRAGESCAALDLASCALAHGAQTARCGGHSVDAHRRHRVEGIWELRPARDAAGAALEDRRDEIFDAGRRCNRDPQRAAPLRRPTEQGPQLRRRLRGGEQPAEPRVAARLHCERELRARRARVAAMARQKRLLCRHCLHVLRLHRRHLCAVHFDHVRIELRHVVVRRASLRCTRLDDKGLHLRGNVAHAATEHRTHRALAVPTRHRRREQRYDFLGGTCHESSIVLFDREICARP